MSFSLARIYAVLVKEFLQMRRDRVTLGMIVGVPLMQLFLFGFAYRSDVSCVSFIDHTGRLQTAYTVKSIYFLKLRVNSRRTQCAASGPDILPHGKTPVNADDKCWA